MKDPESVLFSLCFVVHKNVQLLAQIAYKKT